MRYSYPQDGQGCRWKDRSRMALRKSGRRSALTLCTRLNGTFASQEGQVTSTVRKMDMCGPFLDFEFAQPCDGRVGRLQLIHSVPGVELGEPLARSAELV